MREDLEDMLAALTCPLGVTYVSERRDRAVSRDEAMRWMRDTFSSLERELAEARAPKRWEIVREYHPSTGDQTLLTLHGTFETRDAAQIGAMILNQGGTFGASAYVRPVLSTASQQGESK